MSRPAESRPSLLAACMLLAAGAIFLGGCATPHSYTFPHATPEDIASCRVPIPKRDLLVTVAMSGGGSRAALFGASGLEALAQLQTADGKAVLEQVSYLSSVSGGSIAAAAYVLHKPGHEVSMLEPDGSMTPQYQEFFRNYRESLSQKFGAQVLERQFFSLRWFNPALAANSLSEILGEELLGAATWRDVTQRQRHGDSPGLIVNTTLYNNGRRFAITPLPSETFNYDFIGGVEKSLSDRGQSVHIARQLEARWEQVLPLTPADLETSPCEMSLANVVTGSASFPPLIGPITFQVEGSETFWHLGDGGLYENQGAEPLLFMTVRQLEQENIRRGLIIAFDSSYPFSVGETRLGARSQPFSLLNFDFNRIPSIMEERATTYRGLFFRSLQVHGAFPDSSNLRLLTLRHIDAKWSDDLSDLPPSCRELPDAPKSANEVVQRLALIPTLLSVRSPCDRDLLKAAAWKLVQEHRQEILRFIQGEDPPPTRP